VDLLGVLRERDCCGGEPAGWQQALARTESSASESAHAAPREITKRSARFT